MALDGRLQYDVTGPHWGFTGTLGTFGVFHNARHPGLGVGHARRAGVQPDRAARSPPRPPPRAATSGSWCTPPSAAVLERSESWSTGLAGHHPAAGAGSSGAPPGPARSVPVAQAGVIQAVSTSPAPGATRCPSPTPPAAARASALALSALAAVGLAAWAVTELVGRGAGDGAAAGQPGRTGLRPGLSRPDGLGGPPVGGRGDGPGLVRPLGQQGGHRARVGGQGLAGAPAPGAASRPGPRPRRLFRSP